MTQWGGLGDSFLALGGGGRDAMGASRGNQHTCRDRKRDFEARKRVFGPPNAFFVKKRNFSNLSGPKRTGKRKGTGTGTEKRQKMGSNPSKICFK